MVTGTKPAPESNNEYVPARGVIKLRVVLDPTAATFMVVDAGLSTLEYNNKGLCVDTTTSSCVRQVNT